MVPLLITSPPLSTTCFVEVVIVPLLVKLFVLLLATVIEEFMDPLFTKSLTPVTIAESSLTKVPLSTVIEPLLIISEVL